jgi:flavodoxin
MAKIAKRLKKTEDEALFRQYHEGCKQAYQELVTTASYPLDTDRQARLVRPLAFDLLTQEQTSFAKKRLITALENYGWRLGTGFLSTPLILDVLTDIDIRAAYKLLENEQIPGWLSMPRHGATTIWENWEGPFNTQGAGLGSLNHYSKGAVCRWIFDTMCGIRIKGENRFEIAPHPGGTLTHASAAYTSIYGNTKKAVELLEAKLIEMGCPKVVVTDLARDDMAEAVEDAFRYGKLVLATTTYNGDVFPFMKEFIHHLTERNFQNRTIGLMENGSWAPTAAKVMTKMLEGSKNLTFTENNVKILSALNDTSRAQIEALATELMA